MYESKCKMRTIHVWDLSPCGILTVKDHDAIVAAQTKFKDKHSRVRMHFETGYHPLLTRPEMYGLLAKEVTNERKIS